MDEWFVLLPHSKKDLDSILSLHAEFVWILWILPKKMHVWAD